MATRPAGEEDLVQVGARGTGATARRAMAVQPAGEEDPIPSVPTSAASVSIPPFGSSTCSSATCISATLLTSSIRNFDGYCNVEPVLMPSPPSAPAPNSRRRRRQGSPVPLPGYSSGTADDFPTTFHMPSVRSVRRRLAAPRTAYSGEPMSDDPMEASTSNTRLKRKHSWITLPAAESTISVVPARINIGAANEFDTNFHLSPARSVRCRLPYQPTGYNADLVLDDPMEASTSNMRCKRKQPCKTSPVAESTVNIAFDGINIGATKDFTTDFHVPSKRFIHRRLMKPYPFLQMPISCSSWWLFSMLFRLLSCML
ncbi:unnamed protein product [Urochloa humidicola]